MGDIQRYIVEYACYHNLTSVLQELIYFYKPEDWLHCSVSHVRVLLVWLEKMISDWKVDEFDLVIHYFERLYNYIEPVVTFQLYFNLIAKLKVAATLHHLSCDRKKGLSVLNKYFPENNSCIPLPAVLHKLKKFDLVQKTQQLRLSLLPLFKNTSFERDYKNILIEFRKDHFLDLQRYSSQFLSLVREILRETIFNEMDTSLTTKQKELVCKVMNILNTSHQSSKKKILTQLLLNKLTGNHLESSTTDSSQSSGLSLEEMTADFVPDSFSLPIEDALIPNFKQHLRQIKPSIIKLNEQSPFQQGDQSYVIFK